MHSGQPVVAIVDDDQRVLESLGDLLESAGYQIRRYFAAMELLNGDLLAEVDRLITDIGMPVIDGIELQQMANARRPELPVIFITGRQVLPTQRRVIEAAGAKVFGRNPSTARLLLTAVSTRWRRIGNAMTWKLPRWVIVILSVLVAVLLTALSGEPALLLVGLTLACVGGRKASRRNRRNDPRNRFFSAYFPAHTRDGGRSRAPGAALGSFCRSRRHRRTHQLGSLFASVQSAAIRFAAATADNMPAMSWSMDAKET